MEKRQKVCSPLLSGVFFTLFVNLIQSVKPNAEAVRLTDVSLKTDRKHLPELRASIPMIDFLWLLNCRKTFFDLKSEIEKNAVFSNIYRTVSWSKTEIRLEKQIQKYRTTLSRPTVSFRRKMSLEFIKTLRLTDPQRFQIRLFHAFISRRFTDCTVLKESQMYWNDDLSLTKPRKSRYSSRVGVQTLWFHFVFCLVKCNTVSLKERKMATLHCFFWIIAQLQVDFIDFLSVEAFNKHDRLRFYEK